MSTDLKPGDKVFLVKYAIGRKGEPQEVTVKFVYADGTVHLSDWYGCYKVGRDVALTAKDADTLILRMLIKKLSQVRKQLSALEAVQESVAARAGRWE